MTQGEISSKIIEMTFYEAILSMPDKGVFKVLAHQGDLCFTYEVDGMPIRHVKITKEFIKGVTPSVLDEVIFTEIFKSQNHEQDRSINQREPSQTPQPQHE